MNLIRSEIDYSTFPFAPPQQDLRNIQYRGFDQLIARARMQNKPLLVVEGTDDITVYEAFSKKAGISTLVRAVETFDGYSEGCVHVRNLISDAQSEINKSPENEKFILGIIDRDASYYRDEHNETLKCLFMLNAYSYESHFVTKEHAEYVIQNMVNSAFGINDKIVDFIISDLEGIYGELYYISLEALKHACIRDYQGLLGYSSTYGYIKNKQDIINEILNKKDELDVFANEKNISIADYKTIIKGKWLLDAFVESIYDKITKLAVFCKNDDLVDGQIRCYFCENGIHEKCSWKVRKYYTKNSIYNLVIQYLNPLETQYITERFKQLS
ncbi:hypothetical protein ACS2Q2_13680 [Bacillus cereus group sp. Bce009]|uniref:hypothetical protein n=1 Tax=Bacillus cereus group sp. Bce009 TaxID=3445252 RepID=UPI003F203393